MGVKDADESHGRIRKNNTKQKTKPSETGHQKLKSVDKVNLTNFISIPQNYWEHFFCHVFLKILRAFKKKCILKKLAFLDNLRM